MDDYGQEKKVFNFPTENAATIITSFSSKFNESSRESSEAVATAQASNIPKAPDLENVAEKKKVDDGLADFFGNI